MNASYEQEVRQHAIKASIAYDRFDTVAKLGREVFDPARADEASRLRHNGKSRKKGKSAHWLLLRNGQDIKDAGASASRAAGGKPQPGDRLCP